MQKEYWFVIISGILSGGVVFGGLMLANLGLSSYEITVLPSFFTIIFLLPLVIQKRDYRLTKNKFRVLILYGIIAGTLGIVQYGAVILGTPVSITVLLLYTQPLWTIIFSRIIFKEKITKVKIITVMIVLIGVILLINPFSIGLIGSVSGIIVALIGGVLLSGWIISGKVAGEKGIDPVTTKFGYMFFMLIFLIATYPLINSLIKIPSIVSLSFNQPPRIWFYLLIFELFTSIINHLFYLKGVEKVTASDAGIIMLLEPVSASVLAALFLGQPITWSVILGGLLILVSNYIVIREED